MASITQEQKRLIVDLQAPAPNASRYQAPEDPLEHFLLPFKPAEITIVIDPEADIGFHIYGPATSEFDGDFKVLAKEIRANLPTFSALVQIRRPDLMVAELLKTCCSCLTAAFLAANRG